MNPAASPKLSRALVLVFGLACSLGLTFQPAGSRGLTQMPKATGYHMGMTKPSAGDRVCPEELLESPEAQLLSASLKELRTGNLNGAVDALAELAKIAPCQPEYARLLFLARHRSENESWFRYQSKFQLGWAGTGAVGQSGPDSAGNSPEDGLVRENWLMLAGAVGR